MISVLIRGEDLIKMEAEIGIKHPVKVALEIPNTERVKPGFSIREVHTLNTLIADFQSS